MTKHLAQVGIPSEVGGWVWPTANTSFDGGVIPIALAVLNWLLGFTGAFAVFAIVYSGIMYITSAGNQDQAEKAKKNLTWAITGVVLVALCFVIVRWVSTILHNNAP